VGYKVGISGNSLDLVEGIEPWDDNLQFSAHRLHRIEERRKTNKQRRNLKQVCIAVLVAIILSSGVALGAKQLDNFASGTRGPRAAAGLNADVTSVKYSATPFDTALNLSALQTDDYLQLVSHNYAIQNTPSEASLSELPRSVPAAREGMLLHPTAITATAALLELGQAKGFGPFHVASGFRSVERQAQLYDQKGDSAFVKPAGHSEHHTGLAIDLVPTQLTAAGGALSELLDGSSPDEQWLADNAWRFGFILRYPEGAQAITGIAFESWHFRYVGLPHAWYMWQHNIVLEEYLDRLEEKGGFDVVIGEQSFSVRFSQAENGVVYVPDNREFSISSDNRGTGNYIVTAWD